MIKAVQYQSNYQKLIDIAFTLPCMSKSFNKIPNVNSLSNKDSDSLKSQDHLLKKARNASSL